MEVGILELMRGGPGDGGQRKPPPLPEAAIMRLREHYARMTAPNPWKPGDLVAVPADSRINASGLPMIVIEVEANPARDWEFDGDRTDGFLLDTRISWIDHEGHMVTFWIEHGELIPYVEEAPVGGDA